MCIVLLIVFMCSTILDVVMAAPPLIVEVKENEVITYDFPFVTRSQWQARTAKERQPLSVPVEYVVIHHSYIPGACTDAAQCRQGMRSMQNYHMDTRKWWDIGYNFAVGGDGAAYEGRGWDILGAHALHFNTVSLGICIIGDWSDTLPPAEQLKTVKALIDAGVRLGYIRSDYKLVGHRQVRSTECPGNALYQEIQKWEHYSPYPASARDLVYMKLVKSEDVI